MSIVTEEIVEKVAQAAFDYRPDGKPPILAWTEASPDSHRFHCANMRAALTAVADDMVRGERGLNAAWGDNYVKLLRNGGAINAVREFSAAIRARTTKDIAP